MDRVPSDVIYGLTLDGKGGMTPLATGSEIPAAQPSWVHLDYGNPESALGALVVADALAQ